MFAGHVRARARALGALGALLRLVVVSLGIQQFADLELALGHALDADGAGAHITLAARTTLLARDLFVRCECRRAVDQQFGLFDHLIFHRAELVRLHGFLACIAVVECPHENRSRSDPAWPRGIVVV